MKKKIIIVGIIFLMIYIIFYGATHHFLYRSICGSGLKGLKLLLMFYIPLSLLVFLIYLFFNISRTTKKKCTHCKSNIELKLNICPYCGDYVEGEKINGRVI